MVGDPYRYDQSHLCGMFLLVGYCHHRQKLKAAGWWGPLGGRGFSGLSVLALPWAVPPLQASPGPVCKVGTLSLCSGGSLSSTTVQYFMVLILIML